MGQRRWSVQDAKNRFSEVVEAARAEAAPQVHSRPLDDRLRRHDLRHWARGLAHGVSFPSKTGRYLRPASRTARSR